jgi:hypothetical protein
LINPTQELCFTTHNTHNRQIFMPSAGIQPTIPPSRGCNSTS